MKKRETEEMLEFRNKNQKQRSQTPKVVSPAVKTSLLFWLGPDELTIKFAGFFMEIFQPGSTEGACTDREGWKRGGKFPNKSVSRKDPWKEPGLELSPATTSHLLPAQLAGFKTRFLL